MGHPIDIELLKAYASSVEGRAEALATATEDGDLDKAASVLSVLETYTRKYKIELKRLKKEGNQ
jgi:hypothetical protein